MKGAICASCDALIVHTATLAGDPVAIDAGAVPGGNIALEHLASRDRPIAHLAPNIPAGRCSPIRFVSHLSTCSKEKAQ